MNLQLHLANSFDKEKLVELQSKSLRLLFANYKPKAVESLIIGQAKARLKYKHEIVVVALDKDELVGFACLDVHLSLITALYVHPDFIRQGIGTHLLNFINKTAQESGCKFIKVWSSLTAASFYNTRGFKVIGNRGFFTANNIWIPCVYLKKKLVDDPILDFETLLPIHLIIIILILCSSIGPIIKILNNPLPTKPIQILPEKTLQKE